MIQVFFSTGLPIQGPCKVLFISVRLIFETEVFIRRERRATAEIQKMSMMDKCTFWRCALEHTFLKQIARDSRRKLKVQQTHQVDEYEDQLYNICVGHRVETSQQCVGDGDGSRDPDAHSKGQIQDDTHGPSCQTYSISEFLLPVFFISYQPCYIFLKKAHIMLRVKVAKLIFFSFLIYSNFCFERLFC